MKELRGFGSPALGAGLGLLVFAIGTASAESPEIGGWGVDLEGRDTSVRGPDDFFRHTNGTWMDTFEMPADLSMYGSFTELFLRSEEQVREIIEEAAAMKAPAGSNAKKIGDLYADFLDQGAADAKGLKPLAEEFERVRGATSHEDIARLFARYNRLGGSTPFNFWIDQDAKDPSKYLLAFFQSGLGLPDRDYYLEEDNARFAAARDLYRVYLTDLLTFADVDDASSRAERIYELEHRFAEAHWPKEKTRDAELTYNKMSSAELAAAAPGFPWNVYLKQLRVDGEAAFNVMAPSAYTGMAANFAETPIEVWQDWLIARLIRDNAGLLTREIDQRDFRFTSEALSGAEEQRERWKRGVQFVNGSLGEAVGRIYVERHFTPEAKERIDTLVANVLTAMGERIDGLEWMSAETKVRARDKLSKFTVKVGYPDEWRDYSSLEIRRGDLVGNVWRAAAFESDRERAKLGGPVDRAEWFMSPQTVNAYYNPGMNEIVFPAAILQPPFFDPYADDAVNYGGIGAVIGHEIGHGFDDQGRKYDGDGVLQDWWTEEDAARFKVQSDRLVEQYNGYSPVEGMFVNGELTLGENIGDVGGLEIAYHAYRLSQQGQEPPAMDGMSGDQRFFLGFSQIWRGKIREQLMVQLITADPHSPMEFRVNGSVRNVDAWYNAFGVQPGDGLYLAPDERVRIW